MFADEVGQAQAFEVRRADHKYERVKVSVVMRR
jgi:hypothetical protein